MPGCLAACVHPPTTAPLRCGLLIGLLVAMLIPPAGAQSQAGRGDLVVELRSERLIEARPDEFIGLSYHVENRSQGAVRLMDSVSLPPGWREVVPLFEFDLEPGQVSARSVMVQVGSQTAAGDYDIGYQVRALNLPELSAMGDAVQVAVLAVRDVELLSTTTLPEQLVAGRSTRFAVQVVNQGNQAVTLNLAAEFDLPAKIDLDTTQLTVEAGAQQAVWVEITPDTAITRLARRNFRITATDATTPPDETLHLRFNQRFEVVPVVAGDDPYLRFPVSLATAFGGDDDDQGIQFTLSGNGFVDEARQHRMAFFARAPDREGRSVLSGRDEYWLRYEHDHLAAEAGDLSFSLSPLMSQGRFGRGLGIDLNPRGDFPLYAGGYAVRDRYLPVQRDDVGAYLGWRPLERLDVRVNALRTQTDADPQRGLDGFEDTLLGVAAELRLRARDRLQLEYVASRSGAADRGLDGDATDSAWRINWSGQAGPRQRSLRYQLNARWSGPDFAGRQNDSADYGASVAFPLTTRIRADLNYRRFERNLDAEPSRGAALRENLYRTGLQIELPARWRGFVEVDHYQRDDIQPDPLRDLREQGLRLGLGRSGRDWSLRADARFARTDNRLLDQRGSGNDYTLTGSYRIANTLDLSFNVRIGDDDQPADSRLLREGRQYGGSLNWRPHRNLDVRASYNRYEQRFPEESLRERNDRDAYGLSVRYRLSARQTLSADLRRYESSFGEDRSTWLLSYTVDFGVPYRRKRSLGSLEGRVVRSDLPGAPGLANAVVLVNNSATQTDAEGYFRFRSLPPGDYQLRIDERSLDDRLIPSDRSSGSIRVLSAQTTRAELSLTEGGSISGTLRFKDNGNGINGINGNGNGNGNGDDINTNGLGNILIELTNGDEQRRTLSRRGGAFLFEGLAPGPWQLRVYEHNLPARSVLENGNRALHVEAGQTHELKVRILPRQQRIRIIDEGQLSSVN